MKSLLLFFFIGGIMMFQASVFGVTTTFHQIDSDTFVFEINQDGEIVNYTADNCNGSFSCISINYDGEYTWNPTMGGYRIFLNGVNYYPHQIPTETQDDISIEDVDEDGDNDTVVFTVNLSNGGYWIRYNQTFTTENGVFTFKSKEIDNSGETDTYTKQIMFNRSDNVPAGSVQSIASYHVDNAKARNFGMTYINYSTGQYFSQYIDWQTTHSTSLYRKESCDTYSSDSFECFLGNMYTQKSDSTFNPMVDKIYFKMSSDVWNVINITENLNNPISSYRDTLSEKVIIDYWGSSFETTKNKVISLYDYGVNDAILIKHSWQKCGYDNCYPEVIPAYSTYGGDTELISLSNSINNREILFGLHENYVDFYNNSADWNESDVALDIYGNLRTSFWVPTSQKYSWLMKPSQVLKYAQRYTPNISSTYSTSAVFLDVHTALVPQDRLDYDSDYENASMLVDMYDKYIDLISYLQTTHNGPLLGESKSNTLLYWTGYVDGVEAELGDDNASDLLVDYYLLNIQPYSVNHGVGYFERYFDGQDASYTTEQHVEYRAMEIAFGRAGFIPNPHKPIAFEEMLKEYHIMRPLQVQYTNISVESIEYPNTISSATLVDLSDALKYDNEFSQVHVNYSNGFEVFVNKNGTVWTVNCGGTNYDLPKYGWCGSNPSEDFIGYYATVEGHNITYINSSEFEVSIKHYLGEINVTNKLDNSMIYYNYNGTSKNHTFDTTYKVYDSVSNTILSDANPIGIVNVSDDTGVRIYNMIDTVFYINLFGDYSSLKDSGNLMDVFDIVEDIQGLTYDNDIVLRDSGTVELVNFTTTARSIIFNGAEDQTLVIGDNVRIVID